MEIGENKIIMKRVEYVVDYSNPKKFEAYRETFTTLKAAKECKKKMIKEYKNVDITKRTIYSKLISK